MTPLFKINKKQSQHQGSPIRMYGSAIKRNPGEQDPKINTMHNKKININNTTNNNNDSKNIHAI